MEYMPNGLNEVRAISSIMRDGRRKAEPHSVGSAANVVSHGGAAESLPGAHNGTDAAPLAEGVDAVFNAVEELKARLDESVHLNEALEHDLQRSQERERSLSQERDGLTQRVVEMQEEALCVGDGHKEMAQLGRERDALSRKVHDLVDALSRSEQRGKELGRLIDSIRAERDGASEQAAALEVQFSRAMRVIEKLREELALRTTRAQEHDARVELLGSQLEVAVGQRDQLKEELGEAHSALEEIRESFLAASRLGVRSCT